jgi:hypothetical protein
MTLYAMCLPTTSFLTEFAFLGESNLGPSGVHHMFQIADFITR